MKMDKESQKVEKPDATGEGEFDVVFRLMQVEDLDAIMELEQVCFSVPWSKESYHHELTQNQFAYYVVMEWRDHIIGYGGMWLVMDEAHITNIAIAPHYRGKKLGTRLMQYLMNKAKEKGAHRMTLEVRRTNQVAQNLYEKMGFYTAGIRPQYYSDNHEDAVIMWVGLDDE